MMMTIKEAAEKYSISEYELRMGIKNGKYPFLKVGVGRGKYLLNDEIFEEFLKKESIRNMESNKKEISNNYGIRKVK